jgi:hypothetical protein
MTALQRTPFGFPELETCNVEDDGSRAVRIDRDSLHCKLLFCDGIVAGVALLTIAWSAPNAGDTVDRQASVLELLLDAATDDVRLHSSHLRSFDRADSS